MSEADLYSWWELQLAAQKSGATGPELPPRAVAGQAEPPRAGYYRRGNKAIAFWIEAGVWQCGVSEGYVPRELDQIEELFGSCCRNAVSYEDYCAYLDSGIWPEQVAPVEVAAVDESGAPKTPEQILAAELELQQAAARKWLTDLGHKPQTQDEADKAANFADAFGKIETKAEKARKTEKDAFLKAGQAIDAKWKAVTAPAGVAKVWAKGLSNDFAIAEKKRRDDAAAAENARLQAEYAEAKAKADKEAAEAATLLPIGVDLPPAPAIEKPRDVVAESVKIGTTGRRQSLREREVWQIEDCKSLLHFLADRNTLGEAFLKALQIEAEAIAASGVEVPGLVKTVEQKVA